MPPSIFLTILILFSLLYVSTNVKFFWELTQPIPQFSAFWKPDTPLSKFIGTKPQTATKKIQSLNYKEVIRGIKKPHRAYFLDKTFYIVSYEDQTLYKLNGRNLEEVIFSNFVHDLVLDEDNLLATSFFENKIIQVSKQGVVSDLITNLSGPGFVLKDKSGTIFVSNFISGEVLSFEKDKNNKLVKKVLIKNIKNPAGLAKDEKQNVLYIANFTTGYITKLNLADSSVKLIFPQGLDRLETLYLDSKGDLLATASIYGLPALVKIKQNGEYETLLETDLPAPLNASFLSDTEVLLTSPNDSEGRVIRATF